MVQNKHGSYIYKSLTRTFANPHKKVILQFYLDFDNDNNNSNNNNNTFIG